MCGICGIYGEANKAVIKDMLEAIRHRGPDSFEVTVTGRHSFGAARLALVAKQNGEQPSISEQGLFVLLLNGEIYNYQELRDELIDFIDPGAGELDVVKALYKQYGIKAISMLKGMFALAILDGEKLMLARDRYGIKPMYYCELGRKVLFASEIKALLRHPEIIPELCMDALEETVTFGFICSSGVTPFKNIYQVDPGTIITVTPNGIAYERFGTLPDSFCDNGDSISFAMGVERLRDVIPAAVRKLMRHGDDRKGVYLSGGVDSSLMAVLASEERAYPLPTFTLYDSVQSPDYQAASHVARAIGSEHFEFQVTFEDYLNELPSYVFHYENLVAGGVFDIHGGVAFHMLCKRVSEYVRVAFSGEGADELFGGYYWSHTHPLGLSDRIKKRQKMLGVTGKKVKELVERTFPQPEDATVYKLKIFDLLMKGGLSNYHLWSVDRSSAAFGFEIRPVYLYDDLAEFALTLPVEHKALAKDTKRVLKAAAEPLFERLGISDVIYRKKIGMPAAVEQMRSQVEEFAKTAVLNGSMKHPFCKYLHNPLEAMAFDLFYWFFIEQKGIYPAGFDIREFYKIKRAL